jgi:hypothetical protein
MIERILKQMDCVLETIILYTCSCHASLFAVVFIYQSTTTPCIVSTDVSVCQRCDIAMPIVG